MNNEMKPGDKRTFVIRTVVDDKGICFTEQGDVIIISGVMYGEENVYAEINEVHEKTILAKKILMTTNAPPASMPGNGYDYDDAHEDEYDEEEEPLEDEEGEG